MTILGNLMAYPASVRVFGQIVGAAHACLVSRGSLKVCVGSLMAEVLGTAKAPHPSLLWVINVNKVPHNSSAQLPSPHPSLFFFPPFPPSLSLCSSRLPDCVYSPINLVLWYSWDLFVFRVAVTLDRSSSWCVHLLLEFNRNHICKVSRGTMWRVGSASWQYFTEQTH